MLPAGAPVTWHHAKTAEAEAKWVAARIKALADAGVPLRDIAILYRAHHISRTFEEVFLKEEIPYTIFSGVQFFNRMEIKDALSYLRLVAYRDDLSFCAWRTCRSATSGNDACAFYRNTRRPTDARYMRRSRTTLIMSF